MLILNQSDVAQCLPHAACIDVMATTMQSVSRGDAIMPLRQYMPIPESGGGKMALMPGYLGDPRCFGIKLVNKFPRSADSPLGSHVGAVMVFDADLGVPIALMDGGELTAIRTASASAMATRELAREDSKHLLIIGCGQEAHHHVHAILAIRELDTLTVWGRNSSRAQAFVEGLDIPAHVQRHVATDLPAAVGKADVICAVTSAKEPVFFGADLRPGVHVNLVGAALRDAKETDDDTVTRSRFFTDSRASALDQAGELMDLVDAGHDVDKLLAGEIGQVLSGELPGRQSDDQITVYKSLGVAAQDLAAGLHAMRQAEKLGVGVQVDW